MAGRLDTFGLSDIGLVRERNEDQFLIADLKKSVVIHQTSLSYDDETHLMGGSQAKLFLVADGVIDDLAGERASRLAVQGIVQYLLNTMHWLFRLNDDRRDAFLEDLKSALVFTQEKIRQLAASAPFPTQTGTTITLAYVVWPQVYILHVGGSRAYVFRDQRLIRLTNDDAKPFGKLPSSVRGGTPVGSSHFRHVLFGLISHEPGDRTPEVTQFELQLHDKLLLCTDGLVAHLNDSDIARLLTAHVSAEESCKLLINAANDAGGEDNTTVVLAHFTDSDSESLKQKAESLADSESESTSMRQQSLATGTRVAFP